MVAIDDQKVIKLYLQRPLLWDTHLERY